MKRFYEAVDIAPQAEGFAVLLDGKTVKTPGGRLLCLPARALSEAVAGEWAAQEEHVKPQTMAFTRFANTVLDGIAPDRSGVVLAVAEIFGSDLLCYRAAHPEDLADQQAEAWDPILAWIREIRSIDLTTTRGVMHVPQSETSLGAAKAWLEGLDPYRLAAVHMAATLTGSGVLALALAEGHLDADRAWALSRLDEDWQIRQWGEDAEAVARAKAHRAELDTAARVLGWVAA